MPDLEVQLNNKAQNNIYKIKKVLDKQNIHKKSHYLIK